MKKNVFICLALSFSTLALMAQTGTEKTNPSFPRHEIGIEYGVGYHPVLNTSTHPSDHHNFLRTSPDYCWMPDTFADWFRYSQKTDKYEAQNIGSFTIYYLCNITAKHAVGVSVNACFLKASIESYVREGVIYRELTPICLLYPSTVSLIGRNLPAHSILARHWELPLAYKLRR